LTKKRGRKIKGKSKGTRKEAPKRAVKKPVRKRILERIFPKKYKKEEVREGIKEYVETNIDRLYELVKKDGMVKIDYAAKKFKVSEEQIEEWGNILEEHGLVIIHYPPFGGPVLILKTFKPKVKIRIKGKKHNRKALLFNFIIIVAFIIFILLQTGRVKLSEGADPSKLVQYVSQNWIYLISTLIIIVLVFLIIKFRRGRKSE
jgi:transposase